MQVDSKTRSRFMRRGIVISLILGLWLRFCRYARAHRLKRCGDVCDGVPRLKRCIEALDW